VPGLRRFFALEIPPLEVLATAAGIAVAAAFLLEAGRWVVSEYQRARLAAVRRRARRLLAFLARRLHPEGAFGLTITVSLALLAVAGWALGTIVQDVIVGDDAARLDRPVLDWFVSQRRPWITTTAQGVTALGTSAFLIPLVIIVGAVWWGRRRTVRPLMLLGAAYLGSELLFRSVKALTGRARPPDALAVQHFCGLAFPSGHATQAAAVFGMLAALAAAALPSWRHKVAAWVVALVVVATVGATRLYLGAHWLTDVLGGWALGALWLMALLVTDRAIEDLRRRPAAAQARSGVE
jgi:undecaprenyl-diphosphatase